MAAAAASTRPSPRALNFVHRMRDRARYDEPTIHSILDAALIVHVGFTLPAPIDGASAPEDWPFVIPMAHGRIHDTIYLHGYVSGRIVTALARADDEGALGPRTAITATHVDGLVLALTPFHNSMNYRSACVFGHARLVSDDKEREQALEAITNHAFRGVGGNRWADSRMPNNAEMKSTKVIAVRVEAASAKVRDGQVKDSKSDIENRQLSERVWTGVLPLETRWGEEQPAAYSPRDAPQYVKELLKNNGEAR